MFRTLGIVLLVKLFLCAQVCLGQSEPPTPLPIAPGESTKRTNSNFGNAQTTRPSQSQFPQFQHLAESPGFLLHRDIFELLKFPVVIEEIGGLEFQMAEYRELLKKSHNDMKTIQNRFSDSSGQFQIDPNRRREFKLQRDKHVEATRKAIGNTLLPEQVQRLREISKQAKLRSNGVWFELNQKSYIDSLELTPEQLAELKQKAMECSNDLSQQMQKLKRRYRDSMLNVLTETQRKALAKQLGEEFHVRPLTVGSSNRKEENK